MKKDLEMAKAGFMDAGTRFENFSKATTHFSKKYWIIMPKAVKGLFLISCLESFIIVKEKNAALFFYLKDALGKNHSEKMENMIYLLIDIVNDEPSYAAG